MLHSLLAVLVALFVLLPIQSIVKASTLYKSWSISSCTCLKMFEDLQWLQADVFLSQCCCWCYFHIFQWLHYQNDCIWLWGSVCIVLDFLSLIWKPIFESTFCLLLELISAANSSLQCHVLNLLLLDKVYKDDKKRRNCECIHFCFTSETIWKKYIMFFWKHNSWIVGTRIWNQITYTGWGNKLWHLSNSKFEMFQAEKAILTNFVFSAVSTHLYHVFKTLTDDS